MRYRVRLRGGGRVELAAYGVADAEHRAEKEILGLWPDAKVRIVEVRRTSDAPRIAEEFVVAYRIEGEIPIEAENPDGARREAFRLTRERFTGSRYWSVAWDEGVIAAEAA